MQNIKNIFGNSKYKCAIHIVSLIIIAILFFKVGMFFGLRKGEFSPRLNKQSHQQAEMSTSSQPAGYNNGVLANEVLKTKTTWNGLPLQYLKTNKPEVTVAVVEIAPGAETGWHIHKAPVYAYVLEGTIKVMTENKELTFTKGQAIAEVQNVKHNGKNIGKDTLKLIVFYGGEEGVPNAIKIQ